MIIAALTKYRPADGIIPAGYARKSLGFLLTILEGGGACRLQSLYVTANTGRQTAPLRNVPNLSRSNNPPPIISCDNAAFVIARPKPATDAPGRERELIVSRGKQAAFVRLLQQYSKETGDRAVDDYIRWVEAGMPGLQEAIERLDVSAAKRLDLDLLALQFDVETSPLFEKRSIQQFWERRVATVKAGSANDLCVSCGRFGPVVDTLPQALAGVRIPATSTAQVALMSVNFPAAARGATGKGLKSAPICAACAGAAVTAFNSLAASTEHRFNIGDTSAAVWWATEDLLDESIACLNSSKMDSGRVKELHSSIITGQRSSRKLGRFYFLSFSGNVARLVVRRWLDLDLARVGEHVSSWFADVETPDSQQPYRSLSELASSLGLPPAGDRKERPPDGAFEALLLVALTGTAPPRRFLQLAVQRAIAEIGQLTHDDSRVRWKARSRALARVAIIRLVLNRTMFKEARMPANLDEGREDKAYLSGRLFAVRESLQRSALGDVNASIVDRYFGRAAVHPASVDTALTELEMQHLRAVKRNRGDGVEYSIRARLRQLHDRMSDVPGRLTTEQQAAWIAGYFQQREADIQSAIEKSEQNKLKATLEAAESEEN